MLGIHTAGQLRDMPMKQARAVGSVVLERLVAELRGVPSGVVETIEPQRKGMAVTRSFGTPVNDIATLRGAITQCAMRAGEKLRNHALAAARLTVSFDTNRFKTERPRYSASRMITLHPMTNDSFELIAAARRSVEHGWRDGYVHTQLSQIVANHRHPRRALRRRFVLDDLQSPQPRALIAPPAEERSPVRGRREKIRRIGY